jgi:hypothetical protein
MKKWTTVLLAVVALGGATLMAATINNLSGQSCGDFEGTWHFVNNQTGTTDPNNTLTACFTSGCQTVSPTKITPNGTYHFYVSAAGTLLSATSTLNGKLVLSDFSCSTPPKCDPKTDPNCKG